MDPERRRAMRTRNMALRQSGAQPSPPMKALVLALLATLPLMVTATARDLDAGNDYGIRYETRTHAPGVSRAASWSAHPAVLDARQSSTLIERKDAAFIKVYFDHVHLPAGWSLVVSDPEGAERYVYTADGGADRTVDHAMGQNGSSSFAALSVSADRVQVELLPPRDAHSRELPRVVMSHVLEGYPEAIVGELRDSGLLSSGDPENRAICGLDNKQRPACYSGNAFSRSRAVARILVGGGSCTGWRIGSGDRMMTNNHCIGSSADVSATEVWFNFQHSACSGTATNTVTKVSGRSLLRTSAALDYTLFTINNPGTVSGFGFLSIDPRMPGANEQIYIPQHPGGRLKEIAVNSSSDTGGKCKVFQTQVGDGFSYYCDTEPGSSGSPVISSSNNKVIGLHYAGPCPNKAMRISRIWQEISGHFNNQVP
jgi:hypothetical protein